MIRRICTDEFGTIWYEAQESNFLTQRFPAQVYSERSVDLTKDSDGQLRLPFKDGITYVFMWHQVCSIESFILWGLFTETEAKESGFKVRWQCKV